MITENGGLAGRGNMFFCSLFWQRSVRPSIARFRRSQSLTGILLAAASANAQQRGCAAGNGKCTSAECDLCDKVTEVMHMYERMTSEQKGDACDNGGVKNDEEATGCSFSDVRPIMHTPFLLLS